MNEDLIWQIHQAHSQWIQLRYDHWLSYEAYTPIWWLLLTIALLLWSFWFKVCDRRKIYDISFYGLMVTFIATLSDASGTNQELWYYPIKLQPFAPHLGVVDWALIPVSYMYIYQRYDRWRDFLIAMTIWSALLTFVAEPIGKYLQVYHPLAWYYYYSFPLYIILGAGPKYALQRLKAMEKKE